MSFPPIYLDNNATTSLDPEVARVMIEDLSSGLPLNPSSTHSLGQQAKGLLSKARQTLATYLSIKPKEIIFTSGGTESMNFLIRGHIPSLEKIHIITSNIEHSCIEKTLVNLTSQGHELSFLPATLGGAVSTQSIEQAINPLTKLLVFSAVNSETGVKQDLTALSNIALHYRIPLIIDGVALMGKESFSLPPGITGMGFSAHKFHGPKGIGFAFLRFPTKITPLLTGGGQEHGLRSGTESLTSILGLAKAVECLKKELPIASIRMQELRNYMEIELLRTLPSTQINGLLPRICNVSNLCFPGVSAETLLMQLDLHGIAASHGSACSSGAIEPSRILTQMGIPISQARSSLRFSLSRLTTKEEIDRVLYLLTSFVPKLSSL